MFSCSYFQYLQRQQIMSEKFDPRRSLHSIIPYYRLVCHFIHTGLGSSGSGNALQSVTFDVSIGAWSELMNLNWVLCRTFMENVSMINWYVEDLWGSACNLILRRSQLAEAPNGSVSMWLRDGNCSEIFCCDKRLNLECECLVTSLQRSREYIKKKISS